MYSLAILLAVAGGASARVLARADDSGCCFELKASGKESGLVGQLGDGQNRIGGDYSPATYCIKDGALTDGSGRGCILTPPTTQFQCDAGATPTTGFSVSGSGQILYNGDSKFYACGATKTEYNIYTTPVEGQKDCVEISLSSASGKCAGVGKNAGNGNGKGAGNSSGKGASSTSALAGSTSAPMTSKASAPASSPMASAPASSPMASAPASSPMASAPASSPAPSCPACPAATACPSPVTETVVKTVTVTGATNAAPPATSGNAVPSSKPAYSSKASAPASSPASSPATPAASSSACPTSLNGPYEYPHLIVPVCSDQPEHAYGTSYNGMMNSTCSSIFNFDIPMSYEGKQCSVVFMFPKKEDLETSNYDYNGEGSMGCSKLSHPASEMTSWDNKPSEEMDMGSVKMQPGNSYVMSTGPCMAGTTQSIELSSMGGMSLDFFQDYNPSPLGLYITSC